MGASNKFVQDLRAKRAGHVKESYIIEWNDKNYHSRAFWELVGCSDGVQPKSLPDTSAYEQKQRSEKERLRNFVNKMVLVSDESGIQTLQEGVLDKSLLKKQTGDAVIVDVGRAIFVWV